MIDLAQLQQNINLQTQAQLELLEAKPNLKALIEKTQPSLLNKQNTDQQVKIKERFRVLTQVTEEEKVAILEKLASQSILPSGQMEIEDQLYFEQQLSDLLGINASSEKDGHKLPFVIAQAEAMAHWRTEPNETISDHGSVLEAGLSQFRPAIGWLKPAQKSLEKFGVSVPLQTLPNWSLDRENMRSWYLKQQLVIINPIRHKAAVAQIIDVGPAYTQRFQIGLSPELIRATEAWHPANRGKVVVLFVDQSEPVSLGVKII